MKLRPIAIPAAVMALTLGGCANWNAVKKDFQTKESAAISIDAKQRAIYSVEVISRDGSKRDVVCAEPSPDALSSLAASLGLDAGSAVKSLGLAFSSQEAAASIGLRTQTIQTLRDAMYRLCEGYASGALDDVGFVRLQRRYQGVMLGLLAIEQLTGATVASQAALGGSGGARVGNSLGKVSALVTEARQTQIAAQSDLTSKKAAVAAKTKEVADAEVALKKATDEANGQETPALKAARDAHAARSEELGTVEAARAKAQQAEAAAKGELESLEQLRKELDRASAIGSAGAQLSGVSKAAAGPADPAIAMRVAAAVEHIVTTIVKHDYSKESCLDWMLSRTMRESFTLGDAREITLLQFQIESCREVNKLAHEIELANINAKAMVAAAAVVAKASELPTSAASAPTPGIGKPKPAPSQARKPEPRPTPQPSPAPAPKPAPTVAPAAAVPTPVAPAPAPAPAPVAPQAPLPAPPPPSKPLSSETDERVKAIIERAKTEQPTRSAPAQRKQPE